MSCPLVKKAPIRPNKESIASSYPSVSLILSYTHLKVKTQALLDSGAQANFMSKDLASRLNLPLKPRAPGRLGDGSFFSLWETSPLKITIDRLEL